MRAVRVLVTGLGAAGAAYGLWLLTRQPPAQLAGALGWIVGGIVAHDGLLAPAVVVAGVAVAAKGPARLRRPALWAAVVLGPLTLIAVPVLGRFGAKPDNPSLLDRPYWIGYVALVVLVLAAIAAAELVRGHHGVGADDVDDHAPSREP